MHRRAQTWMILVLVALLFSPIAPGAEAEHPADSVLLAVVDGPRHDLAFDDDGPLAPLYEAKGGTFANETWTAGPAKTVPGHASLLTGSPQPIANDGSQRPSDPLVWDRLAEDRGWGPTQMRWLYPKDKLAVLATEDTGGGRVEGGPPDEAMLAALEANRTDEARLVVASFAGPDRTGHEGDWAAHREALSTIADGLAPLLADAGPDELVVVTSDHARFCDEPEDHGRLGPLGSVDDCDAHIPLWVAGWHTRTNASVDACLTQADVGVLVAEALGTGFAEAEGRFPEPLVDAQASWNASSCPPTRGGVGFGVPAPGSPGLAVAVFVALLVTAGARIGEGRG